jgi:hypothetical protein
LGREKERPQGGAKERSANGRKKAVEKPGRREREDGTRMGRKKRRTREETEVEIWMGAAR